MCMYILLYQMFQFSVFKILYFYFLIDTTKLPWPSIFSISFDRFSEDLVLRAKQGISHLNWNTRHELLNVLAADISKFTLTPDLEQRRQVAHALVQRFPLLKSSLADGLSGWTQRIYDKMKDVRRAIEVPEFGLAKRKRISQKPGRGEVNFCPLSQTSAEQEQQLEEEMKIESSKPSQSVSITETIISKGFAARRTFILENICALSELHLKYPLLFTSIGICAEFKLLQTIDPDIIMSNLNHESNKIKC